MPHIRVNELGQHWFRNKEGTSVKSESKCKIFSFLKMHLKYRLRNDGILSRGGVGDELKRFKMYSLKGVYTITQSQAHIPFMIFPRISFKFLPNRFYDKMFMPEPKEYHQISKILVRSICHNSFEKILFPSAINSSPP